MIQNRTKIIDNQQDYVLNNKQVQVLLTGTFGDGSIQKGNISARYTTNCIHKEYLEYKENLLGDLVGSPVRSSMNKGFKEKEIYSFGTLSFKSILDLHNKTIQEKLDLLDDLGLALWFYDDGSKHKKYDFYNLNTHAFSFEDHVNYLKPYFDKKGFECSILEDKKKDGRIFYYLYFGRHISAYKVAVLLNKYQIPCFEYKRWSSETIQKWSKLLVQLKSENKTVGSHMFTAMLNKIVL